MSVLSTGQLLNELKIKIKHKVSDLFPSKLLNEPKINSVQ